MLVKEVLERIRFNTSTVDDLTGKGVNELFSNRNVVQQLKYALDKYANVTKAIEAIYTVPVSINEKFIDEPLRVLRTKAYKMGVIYIQGRQYCLKGTDDVDLIKSYFPYEISGPPRFLWAWEKKLYFYPTIQSTYYTTNLTLAINATTTTIPVGYTKNFPLKNGYLTIDDEKIHYQWVDDTNFYGCIRGAEDTIPANHLINSTVSENNCQIQYYKKHFDIPVSGNNFIDPAVLNLPMEICDEHLEVITDYTSFKLLSKVDVERAQFYKVNFDEWLDKAKFDIEAGRYEIVQGQSIPGQFLWETNSYVGNII